MKKLYIVIALLMSLTSCNKWLDVELDNKIDDNKLFSTAEGFKEALAGIYSEISKSNMYGEALTMQYVDFLAQYYSYGGVSNNYEYWKQYDYKNSATQSTIATFWSNLYRDIGEANNILAWADKNASVLTESERNQIRGEALGLRAYLHFDLYRLFSPDVKRSPKANGIPYNKEFGVSLPPMYSAEEVLQLIINDLKEAEECLADDPIKNVVPYQIVSTVEGKGDVVDAAAKDAADKYVARINLYAVKAMLARAYQARGEYTKAIEKAEEVINSGKFRLLEFESIDQSGSAADILFSDEHIFSLRNKALNTYSTELHRNKVTNGATTFAPLPFSDVTSMYESNNEDVRYAKWFDQGTFVKFTPDSTTVYPQKMPMIKLSEMYLLAAECSYSKDPDDALKYVNELRDHRIRNNKHWRSLTKEYLFEEMKREYVGEGQLWYVYKRNNLSLPDNSAMGSQIAASDNLYVFPMPDAESEAGHRPKQ